MIVASVLALGPVKAVAQNVARGAAEAWGATRPELLSELERLAQLAQSPAYGERLREDAARQANDVRRRLAAGDFAVGDRFIVSVAGSVPLEDTVLVLAGPQARVGNFGAVQLSGVLRSELHDRVLELVRGTVLDASVEVRPLLRLAVYGSVSTPGYLLVPPETRVDELLTLAGGPSTEADLQKMQVIRADTVILRGSDVLGAIASGRTVAQLGLAQGDLLSLRPRPPPWDRASVLQIVALFATPIITFLAVR